MDWRGALVLGVAFAALAGACRGAPAKARSSAPSASAASSGAVLPPAPVVSGSHEEEPPEWESTPGFDAFDAELQATAPAAEVESRADQHQRIGAVIDRARARARGIERRLVAAGRLEASDA